MQLYNTLTRTTETIKPQMPPRVTIYTCGPTVYDYPHIGNWFTFVRYDVLVRALRLAGLHTDWVMNITDVGHLVGDADDGEDKLQKGARREGKTAWDVAKFYGDYFVDGLDRLRITKPTYLPKATEHIREQIDLVRQLEAKGYTYVIDDGVYFDTSKFPQYADFARLDLDEQQAGARVEYNSQKRNVSDFALWKFSPKDERRDMEWWAPWQPAGTESDERHQIGQSRIGQAGNMQGGSEQQTAGMAGSWGFPGWHVECSAMGMKYLGQTIDIHSGGIDHIPVHHTNEIAQSQAATGQPFANYWMHTNHITIEGEKISKSLGNGITLEDVEAHGFDLQVLRLHILESHYRSQSKFSWESLEAASNRLRRWQELSDLRWQLPAQTADDTDAGQPAAERARTAMAGVKAALLNDLDTPAVMGHIEEIMNLMEQAGTRPVVAAEFGLLLQFIDQYMGIDLFGEDIDDEQRQLLADRQAARTAKDWARSDELRDKLQNQGIGIRDNAQGATWFRLR